MATMLKHVRAKVPPPRCASRETYKVVLMGLRKDRSKRIQTAGRFSELIGQCIGYLRAVKEGRIVEAPHPSGATGATGSATTPHHGAKAYRSGTASAATQPSDGVTEERAGRTVAIVLGLLAIGLIFFMLFGDFGSTATDDLDDEPDDSAKTQDARGEKEPAKLPMNRALVSPGVAGAQVHVDGVYQCATPCEIKVPVGDGLSHRIRLSKEGFREVSAVWKPKNVGEPLPQLAPMEKL